MSADVRRGTGKQWRRTDRPPCNQQNTGRGQERGRGSEVDEEETATEKPAFRRKKPREEKGNPPKTTNIAYYS